MVYLKVLFQGVTGTRRGNISGSADEQNAHPLLHSSHEPSAPDTRTPRRGAAASRELVSANSGALLCEIPLGGFLGILSNIL
jgi:hypothetical protein